MIRNTSSLHLNDSVVRKSAKQGSKREQYRARYLNWIPSCPGLS